MIDVTFNGVKLSKYIRVTDVISPIGNNRELTLSENLSIGATVTEMRRGVKEHIIKFDIEAKDAKEREELKHILAGIFDVEKPVKITYSNEPYKYYLGIPSGEVTLDIVTRIKTYISIIKLRSNAINTNHNTIIISNLKTARTVTSSSRSSLNISDIIAS